MIRELACALLLFTGAVHATSFVCSLNHRCVYYQQCQDGVINTDGAGLINPRTPHPVPAEVPYPHCEAIGQVCCRHPKNPDGPDDVVDDSCPFHHRCVGRQLCIDGEINTSGIGLIDVRVYQNVDCSNSDGSNAAAAVCCRKPYPADTCPENQSCLPVGECNGITTAPQGTYVDCYLDASQTEVGVCCEPLDITETCSNDGSVQCMHSDQCTGTIFTHDNGNDVECYLNGESTGVCCKPPRETCPEEFVCLPYVLCQGDVLHDSGASFPLNEPGPWQQCLLTVSGSSTGVCCTNPSEPTGLPPANDECGVRNLDELYTRIQNTNLESYQAEFAEFPWQAIIFFTNFTFKCGASLVENQWLLTAAHCVNGFQPSDIRVRLGEWQVDKYDELGQYIDVDVQSITIHPDFNVANLHNDIAVIQLAEPVEYEYHINRICLPDSGQFYNASTRCISTGWGKDAFDDGAFQVILKKVDLPLVDNDTCQYQLGAARLGYHFILDRSFLCAGGEEGKDACTGDGGGPLACEDPVTGRYVLAGITAWGLDCGLQDVPGVYVDVQYFREWLDGIISPSQQTNTYGRK